MRDSERNSARTADHRARGLTPVWDLPVRVTHAMYGVLVLGAFFTSDNDAYTPLHTRLGLVLLGVVLFRVVWGFVGTRHARFKDFLRPPRDIAVALRAMVRGKPGHFRGHNPVGAVMVVALLATLLAVVLSGAVVALGPEWNGPIELSKPAAAAVKAFHEAAAWTLPVLLVFHISGAVLSSVLEKQNLVASMVTGLKRAEEALPGEPPRRPTTGAGFLAALLVGLCASWWLWHLMPIGSAEAAPPLLAHYEQAARAESPAFTGFDAGRGRALYFEEHESSSGKVSCATCHTADARKTGRSPAGKVIEPLAPLANPERFAQPAKADKWFDRNCKQVLGRPCTARERGDVLTYLLAL